jgi:hypothetical protein
MSRRKRRPAGAPAPADEPAAANGDPDAGRRTWRGIAADVTVLVAVFAVTVAVAELAGAANLGVALGIGQVVFAIALVVVLLRG